MNLLRRTAIAPIRFYRRFISPLTPPMCRFSPTCSAYAQEAVGVHGLLRGGALALWRVLRCHPFGKGGFDPVPPGAEGDDRVG
ncbi:MAG: membrane protein insertion efficiency factor YidD [Planctomycetes bacterium]|nr:membrane protein insertion efficiency factor YidD [Planctomycetota bacterium]MDP6409026.1 membrane protein insertion efficiency factor YidD [Planctomycetota bacterium]